MALFNAPSGPPFKGLYIYAFLAFMGFVIADLGIMFLRPRLLPQGTPQPPKNMIMLMKNPPVMTYKNITTRNIFNEDGLIPDPVSGEKGFQGPLQDNTPVRTSLTFLKLLGTIVHFNPRLSIATIHLNNSNKAQAFRVGEQIETAALITEINRRKVVFRNLQNQRLEFIDIPESSRLTLGFSSPTTRTSNPEVNINTTPPQQQGDVVRKENNQFEISRDSLAKYTDNLPNILQQARVLPNTGSDGKHRWFSFYFHST